MKISTSYPSVLYIEIPYRYANLVKTIVRLNNPSTYVLTEFYCLLFIVGILVKLDN